MWKKMIDIMAMIRLIILCIFVVVSIKYKTVHFDGLSFSLCVVYKKVF